MLVSCPRCGRIHERGYRCPRIRVKAETDTANFRRTTAWKKKSLAIRQRDNNLCQVCLTGKYLTNKRLSYQDLSVHHIVPVAEAPELALDDSNLISLCPLHHELAESGYIPRADLRELVAEVPPAPEAP